MRNLYQSSGLKLTRSVGNSICVVFSAASVLLISAASLPAQDDIAKLIDQARSEFKPIGEEQSAAARDDARARMKEVAEFVDPSSENGKHWLHFLRWDPLKESLATEQLQTIKPIEDTLAQINRNENGLENRHFRRLAKALRRYHDLAVVSSWKDKAPENYNKLLEGMRRNLDAYRKEATPQVKQALTDQLTLIDGSGQSPKLVEAVRHEVAQPNAFVEISTSLIAASAGPINRDEPITDCILGTNIHGHAHSTGKVDVVSVPSDNKAVVVFKSKGHSFSNNTGFNGPAVIHSTSDTDFSAKKRVELSDAAFTATSATANATTDLHIHSVAKQGGGLGSRLVSSIGWRKAQSSRGQAEAIAADHAEGRIAGHFDDELNDEVQKARKRYEDEYRRPLERRGEVPEHIVFSSNKSAVKFEVTQASHTQLGAVTVPPEASEHHDVTMRLHESAVDNYSASILGGATARQTKADEDVKFNVHMPKWMDKMWKNRKTEATNSGKEEPFKQFALKFRENRPFSVNFANDKVKLTIHIAHLTSGDKDFDNWDVTGSYAPKISDGKVILTRKGELDVSHKAGGENIAKRQNLKEELNKRSDQGRGFPKTIQFDPVKPEGKMADAGPLAFSKFTTGQGWVIIGMDRQSKGTRK